MKFKNYDVVSYRSIIGASVVHAIREIAVEVFVSRLTLKKKRMRMSLELSWITCESIIRSIIRSIIVVFY